MVKPAWSVPPALVEDFLTHFPNVRVEPITVEIARLAARIRASTAAPTPDAMILATAITGSAGTAIGNDAGWPGIVERAGLSLRVLVLDSVVGG